MKKILYLPLAAIFASLSTSAQDEWNSTPNSTAAMYRDGNVGIGTGGPTGLPFVVNQPGGGAKVSFGFNSVLGTYGANTCLFQMASPTVPDGSYIHMNAGSGSNRSELIFGISTWGAGIYSGKGPTGTTMPILFYTNGPTGMTEKMRIQVDGKVGIGQPASYPGTYKLYVKDGILTEKVKVAIDGTANWSDYVFASNYQLRPLEEVEAFVKNNKHLPGIPSAEEVVKDGLDLGSMDAKLLEKIEELTLYVIELKKEMEKMKKEQLDTRSAK